MSTISFPNMDASKIYLWARYISEQDIFLNKIYSWARYIYEQNTFMSKIYLWAKYIYEENKYVPWLIVCYIWVHNMDAYALLYFAGIVDPPICQLPEFFYLTCPWNHTIEIESYHLEVMCLSNNQDHMLIT